MEKHPTKVYVPIAYPVCWTVLRPVLKSLAQDPRFLLSIEVINTGPQEVRQEIHKAGLETGTFDHFLKWDGPKVLLTASDFTCHSTAKHIQEARKRGIRSVGIQHGLYTNHAAHVPDGHRPIADICLTWNHVTADLIIRRFQIDPENVITVGNPNFVHMKRGAKPLSNAIDDKKPAALLLCDFDQVRHPHGRYRASSSHIHRAIGSVVRLMSQSLKSRACILRRHPTDLSEFDRVCLDQLRRSGFEVAISETNNASDAIESAQACFVMSSSLYAESILMGKPTIFLVFCKFELFAGLPLSTEFLKTIWLEKGYLPAGAVEGVSNFLVSERSPVCEAEFVKHTWGGYPDSIEKIVSILEDIVSHGVAL